MICFIPKSWSFIHPKKLHTSIPIITKFTLIYKFNVTEISQLFFNDLS